MKILAVDPGPLQSAYCGWDGKVIGGFGKHDNSFFLTPSFRDTWPSSTHIVIEKVECYGMPVGADIFETVYFSGRLAQHLLSYTINGQLMRDTIHRVPRREVKLYLCGTARAKDGNIIQALKDRFGDKGTKSNPGFFYGFSKDVWQSFALAVTYFDCAMLATMPTTITDRPRVER